MLANELLDELEQFGGVPLLMAEDPEGNGYRHVSGIDMVWATKDLDGVYDSLDEAEESGYVEEDLMLVGLIYP